MKRFVLLLLCAAWPAPADAGQSTTAALSGSAASSGTDIALPFEYDGPPPPQLPATLVRDAEGRTTVRAVRLAAPLRIDGLLDEALYRDVTPITDFIQSEPQRGAPATERTEAWISFDQDHVYISVRAHESQPERMIVNEMRRDSNQVRQNEHISWAFDTFYDRRGSYNFDLNAIGGRRDGQNINDGTYNGDWNPIWSFATRRNPEGWTAEAAIPFKSLRYRAGTSQIWGLQLRRNSRWKNEMAYLTMLPPGVGDNGLSRSAYSATLVGIEAPAGSRAIDLKPYAVSGLSTDLGASPRIRNDLDKDAGFDMKVGVTQGLTADLTYNTDFAQVEADEQQINLTRFSLFFPEKRDFFIENQGLFSFGVGGNRDLNTGDVPVMFYSRRIGLEQGHVLPIDGGGRLTGRSGRYSVGVLDIQAANAPAFGLPSTNFGVARIRRDILRRSAIGAIATRRSAVSGGTGSGETFGVDGTFAFFDNLQINTFWATTRAPGLRGDDHSSRAQFNYNADRYGVMVERLAVGDDFTPEVGFVRRENFTKHSVIARFSPRPARIKRVRKFNYEAGADYYQNGAGQKETRMLRGEFNVEFQTSDRLEFWYQDNYEQISAPFRIATGVTVPVGAYALRAFRAQVGIGQQRFASGNVFAERGSFYGGTRTQVGYTGARVKLNPRVALEPSVSVNRVHLPFGDFTARLVSSRVTYTITPMMFVSSLVQYNSSNNSLSTNARMRWEYLPGSELFVVYNEGRDTQAAGAPYLQNRSFVVKINRLVRF